MSKKEDHFKAVLYEILKFVLVIFEENFAFLWPFFILMIWPFLKMLMAKFDLLHFGLAPLFPMRGRREGRTEGEREGGLVSF